MEARYWVVRAGAGLAGGALRGRSWRGLHPRGEMREGDDPVGVIEDLVYWSCGRSLSGCGALRMVSGRVGQGPSTPGYGLSGLRPGGGRSGKAGWRHGVGRVAAGCIWSAEPSEVVAGGVFTPGGMGEGHDPGGVIEDLVYWAYGRSLTGCGGLRDGVRACRCGAPPRPATVFQAFGLKAGGLKMRGWVGVSHPFRLRGFGGWCPGVSGKAPPRPATVFQAFGLERRPEEAAGRSGLKKWSEKVV
jgi:hypothetical protein